MGWFGKSGTDGSEPPLADERPLPGSSSEHATSGAIPRMTTPASPITPDSPSRDSPARDAAADARSSLAGLLGAAPFAEPLMNQPPAEPMVDAASVFSESVEIEGSIEGQGDVMLRGRVRGSVSISGCLIVGQGGVVQADVTAREVVNAGTVEGNITAAEKVRVQTTGVVQGDIDAPCIIIDDGGGVEGFVHMQPPGGVDDDEIEDDLPPRPAVPAAARFRPAASPASIETPANEPQAPAPTQPAERVAAAAASGSGGDPFADFTGSPTEPPDPDVTPSWELPGPSSPPLP